jgi:hypothetical protein
MNTRFKSGDKFKAPFYLTLIRPLDMEEYVLQKDGTIRLIINMRQHLWWADVNGVNHPVMVCLDDDESWTKVDDYYQKKESPVNDAP